MQTTLRIDDGLYREAKAEAAREGLTLTRFLEEGLRMRLEQKSKVPARAHRFRVFRGDESKPREWGDVRAIAEEAQLDHDLGKLGIRTPRS